MVSKKYISKRKPWAHQQKGLDRLEGQAAFALLMAMRTGKTKTLLDDFGRLELVNNVQDLLVVAPAGVYRTWLTAAEEHLSDDLRGRMLTHIWEAGAGVQATRQLDWFMTQLGKPRMLLVNAEATSTVKRARDLVKAFLDQRDNMSAYDESTTIKGPKSERALFAVEEVKPRSNYRRILSGLPTPKSPLDAYMQFNYLDHNILGFGSYQAFQMRHAVMKNAQQGRVIRLPDGSMARNNDGSVRRREIPIVVGYREAGSIRKKIEGHSYRVLLEDCYDLPPKMYFYRDVEMHPEQKRVYDEIKQYASAKLSETEYVSVSMVVTQILRLHQVLCGHVKTEEGQLVEVPENRTEAMLDMLEEYDGKVIIWCSYDYNIQRIAEAIGKRFGENGGKAKVARFWGGNRSTREAEEKMFQEDPECRWIVATAAAGGRGRMWAIANLSIYFSNTGNYEHRAQSEERAQGVDKKVSVGYCDLRVPGTVDMKMISTLKRARSLSDEVTGDEWREWLV